jgi:4-amino-4-deoxy-L-arabinose transferase-like glycosyltransferase
MINKSTLFLRTLTERQILLILFGITLGLRLYAVLMAKGIAYDSAGYGFMARDFLGGDFIKGLSYPFPPLYPFLISLISFDSAHVEIAGRLISLFFGTLTLIPVYYLMKAGAGQKIAIFSGLFYSFHPYLVTYSGMLLSEATYWGLLTFSIYFFWKAWGHTKALGCMVSGVCLGLSYLTRPEGIGYLFIFLIWIAINGGIKRGWFKKFILIGALIVPLFILAVPYLIHIHHETGQWLISKKAVGIQYQLLAWDEREGIPPRETENTASQILQLASKMIRNVPFTTYHYLRAYHFALWLFLFLGLIRVRQKRGKWELFLLSLVLFHLFSLSIITSSNIRFSVPLIPLSLFWAGAGVLQIQRYFEKIKISSSWKWVSFLIILSILIQLPQSMKPERRHRADQKSVGLWIQENTPKDSVIMSNSPIEAFYGNREFVPLPPGIYTPEAPAKSYREIIQFAKEKKVRYILINKNTYALNPDFEGSIRSTDLREFYRYKEKEGKWITVYEVIY